MPEPTLDPVPFRVEFLGDPALPFIVVDGGDRSKPFDKHTMRSGPIPGEVKVEFVQLWEAKEALRQELAAVTEQRDLLLEEARTLKAVLEHREATEQVAASPAAGAVAEVTTARKAKR